MLHTTNLNLSKPELTDTIGVTIPALSTNADIIDALTTALLTANGWFKDSITGFIVQWGTYTTPSGQTTSTTSGSPVTYFVSVPNINLPIAFQTACLYTGANVLGVAALWANSKENATNPKTQIDLIISGVSNYGAYFQSTTVRWFAVGK